MMRPMLLMFLLASPLIGCAVGPAMSDGGTALLLATLEWDEFLGAMPQDPEDHVIYFGGIDRLHFRVEKVLIGTFAPGRLAFTTSLSGAPTLNSKYSHYLIVVKKTPDGPRVVRFEMTLGSLCWDEKLSKELGLDFNAVSALEKKYPCS